MEEGGGSSPQSLLVFAGVLGLVISIAWIAWGSTQSGPAASPTPPSRVFFFSSLAFPASLIVAALGLREVSRVLVVITAVLSLLLGGLYALMATYSGWTLMERLALILGATLSLGGVLLIPRAWSRGQRNSPSEPA